MTYPVVSGQQLWQWFQDAKAEAMAADISVAEVDWLLQEWAGLDRLTLRLGSFQNQSIVELRVPWSELTQLWQRRVTERVPIQYLTGSVCWRHFCLQVSPAVLIPRPETELLIDFVSSAVASSAESLAHGHWVDLGTGSGAIALGLAENLTNATIHAVDCSTAALAIARQNAEAVGLGDRVQFYPGYWWEPLKFMQGQVSGMVSNPPYIPTEMMSTLQPEVTQHEPHLALDGGSDGLDCIRHLVETAPTYLHSGGVWLVEMMAGQAKSVAQMLHHQGSYCQIEILPDLAGIERFAIAYRR